MPLMKILYWINNRAAVQKQIDYGKKEECPGHFRIGI